MPALLPFPSLSFVGFRVPLRILATAALIAGALIAGPAVGQPSPVPRGDDRFGLIEPWGLWEDTGSVTTKWKFDPFGPSARYGTGDLTGSDTYIWIWKINKDDPWPSTFGWSFGVSRYPPVSTSENDLGTKPKEYGYQGKSGDVFHQGSSTPWGPEIDEPGDKIMVELNLAENELTYYTKRDGEADFELAGSGPAFNNLTDYSDDDEHVWRAAASIRAIRPSSLEVVYANARPRGFETPELSAEGDLLTIEIGKFGNLGLDDRGPLFNYLDAILIDTLPTTGELFLDENSNGVVDAGEAVEEGDEIRGTLTWAPPEGSSGTVTDSFKAWPRDEREYSNDSKTISMSLTLPNSPPVFTESGPFSVDENSPGGTKVGNVDANDGDGGGADVGVTYAITDGNTSPDGDGQSAFTIDANTGAITVNDSGDLDFEATSEFTLTVQADDGKASNSTASQSITVNVTDVDEAPTLATNQTFSLNEGATSHLSPSVLEVTDPESGPSNVTYTIDTDVTEGELFNTNTSTQLDQGGTFTQADVNGGDIEYQHDGSEPASESFDFTGADGTGGSVSGTFTITINQVNDAPVVGTNTGSSVDKGSNDTITQSELEATDPEQGASSLTYTIDSDVSEGELVNATGPTQLDQGDTFTQADVNGGNIEYQHDGSEPVSESFDFTVTDGADGSVSGTFSITINQGNEAPTVSLGSTSGSIDENNTPPNVLTAITIDDDASGSNSLSLSGADAGAFNINGSNQLEFTATADFESKSTYDVTVEVNDPGVGSDPDDSQGFSLSINDTSPTIANQTVGSVDENAANGTTVGTVTTGGDPSPTTFSITSNVNPDGDGTDAFAIDGSTGEVTVADRGDLDFEQTPSLDVTVEVTDGNSSPTATVTVDLNDVNEAPTVASPISDVNVDEDAPDETIDLTNTFSDPEQASGDLTFAIDDNTNTSLLTASVDNSTDELTLSFASDASGTATITVNATDGGTQSVTDVFDVTVSEVNDAPTIAGDLTLETDEGTSVTLASPTDLDATDPDDSGPDLTYTVTNGPSNGTVEVGGSQAGSFTEADLDGGDVAYVHDGSETSSDAFDLELADGGEDGAGPATATVDVTVNPVNDAPTVSLTPTSTSIDEHNSGDVVVSTISIADDGSGTNNLSLSGTDAGSFTITGTDLEFTDTADFESKSNYDVTVEVDDPTVGSDPDDSQSFSLSINDVNEPPTVASPISDVSVDEDAADESIDLASVFSDPEQASGDLSFAIDDNTNTNLLTASVDNSTDALTLNFASDASGTATITVSATDGGAQSVTDAFDVTVSEVNDAPTYTASDPAGINEDAGGQSVADWATFDPGPPNESGQGVSRYDVSGVTNPALFADEPAVDASGTLTYTPAADANGTSDFTVTVTDDGGTPNGGEDESAEQTFTITIQAVNDAPSIAASDPAAIDEDAGAQSIADWATFDPGPSNESGQSVSRYDVSGVTNSALFADEPAVDASGTLTYTAAAGANGTSDFTVTVTDDGGTPNGGEDESAEQTFTITVQAVNDAPVVETNAGLAVDEGQTESITQGELEATDPEQGAGSLTYTIDTDVTEGELFNANASTQLDRGDTFTQADVNGGDIEYQHGGSEPASESFDFTVSDGAGESVSGTVSVTINQVNDAPTLSVNTRNPTFTEDGSAAGVFSGASVDAIESGQQIQTLRLTVTNLTDGSDEILVADGTDVTLTDGSSVTTTSNGLSASVSVSAGTGTVTLRGSVSASTAETIINGLAYKNASEDPSAASDRTVTLTQIVDDGSTSRGGANTGSFSESSAVDLQAVNDAPVANNDTDATDEDTSVSAAAPGVLGNDSDVDDSSGALSVASVEGSSGNVGAQFTTSTGALFTLNDDGSYTYDPNGQFENLATGETAQDQITYTTQDDDTAASGQATLTVTINGTDDVPVFTAAGPFSVGEAASNGTSVGDVGANDGDGGATDANVTYAITAGNTDVKSNTDVPFSIDSNSGAITVNDASDLDFENPTNRFSLTVQADDGTSTSTATVTVNVTDVAPSQPTDADGANNDVSETASNGTAVGVTASSTDPAGGTVSYLLTDDAGGRFQIDGSSGEVTLADRSLLDFESAETHTVTVRADDADGTQSATQDISISVTDAPVALANQTVGPASEDAANGAAVGTVATTGDAASSFGINGGNPGSAFAIDNSGQITVATASAIDFETKSSYSLTVSASDGTTSDDGTVAVDVTDVNDPPAVTLSTTAPTLDENNTPPSSVATISIDDDALGTNTLSLSGTDASSFQISGTDLQFTSAANFETQNSYDVTVRVNDPDVGGTPDDSESLTLSIDDVNEAPQITNSPAGSVDEDASYGFTPSVTDPDQGDTETFSIVNQPSWASFDSGTGELSGTPANADVGSYADIEITVADRDGATDTTGPFTIDVNPVNDAPTISSLANQTIDEDDQTGALSTTLDDDDDPAGSLTLSARSSNQSLLPDSNLALGGSGADRTVTAIPTANASGTATVTVTVSDGEASASTAFVLTVEPVNDPPVADDDSYGIPEDQRLEIVTERAAVLANDSDIEGDPLSATLASGPSDGSLSLNADGTFTYEPNADFDGTDTFTYTAHDGNGGSDQATAEINVQPVNDAPTIAALADQTIDEDSSLTDVSVTIGDAETSADKLTVTAESDNHDLLPPDNVSLDGSGTDRTLTAAPAADSSGTATITLTAGDGDKTTVQSFVLTVDPVNDPPVAVEEIPDVVLAVDGPTLEMTGLAESVFEDVENDPIALSGVSLTNSGVVSSEIAGSVVTLTPRAVGSAEAVLAATDGTDEGSAAPFTVTVESNSGDGGEDADESATAVVSARRRSSTTVDFGSTGTDLEIREMGASVAGVIRMHFYLASEDDGNSAAMAHSKGAEETFDNLSTYRWEAEGTVPFESANLRFDLSDEDVTGITDPSSVTVVKDTAGTGEFEAVTTIYDDGGTPNDPSDDALVAEGITTLGTFRLASNDPANLLPVELAGFTVELDGEAALLQWQTASETNNAGFYVERTATGAAAPERWSQLGFVEGNGSTEEAQRYRFTDRNLPFSADSLVYRLRQVDTDGTEHLSGVVTIDRRTVEEVALQGSFPNPARSQATIRYALPEAGDVELIVYDLLGRRVATLVDERQQGGRKTIRLDAGRLPSGTYVYRLTAGGATKTRKFVVVH